MPETRHELIDGKVVYVPPAEEPHANRHPKLGALLEAYVKGEYTTAIDMLTRVALDSDVAPDACVYLRERDPETGGRRLEELAFEIVGRQSIVVATKKARSLSTRGVRRIFVLDLKKKRVLEWSRRTSTWRMLDPKGHIEDRAFVIPLHLHDLVEAASSDGAVARALIAKDNPVIAEENARHHRQGRLEGQLEGQRVGQAEGRREGQAEERASALLDLLRARGLRPTQAHVATIRTERDLARLRTWFDAATTARSVREVLAPSRSSRSRIGSSSDLAPTK